VDATVVALDAPVVSGGAPTSGERPEEGPDGATAGETLPRGWRAAVLAVLAVLFLVMGVSQARSDSMTFDEAPDLAGGLAAVVQRDAGITPEHGLLPRVIAGLAALPARPVVPEVDGSGDWFAFTDELVRSNAEAGRLEQALFLARLPTLGLGLLSALIVHVLAARWFGRDAALVAAGAWLTAPLVLGLHHLALTDPATATAVLVLVLATARLLEAPSDGRAVAAGAALGAVLLCRHATLPLAVVPVVAAAVGAAGRREQVRRAAIVAVVGLAVVWGAYRVVDPSGPQGSVRGQRLALVEAAGEESAVARLVGASPMPLEWRAGFGHLIVSSEVKVASGFGQRWEGGRPWYYPAALLVASPPATAALLVLGPLGLATVARARRRRAAWLLGGTAALYLGPLMIQPLQLGPRLMLPVLALGLVAGSAAVPEVRRRATGDGRRVVAATVAGLVIASHLALFVTSGPSSIGWTPPYLRPEHRWAGAAATDIGQDRDRIADWAAGRAPVAALVVVPLGHEPPGGTVDLRTQDPSDLDGWVVTGASALITFGDDVSWLRAYCPVGAIGRSTLVYRFDGPPDTRPGPGLPAAACPAGQEFSSRR